MWNISNQFLITVVFVVSIARGQECNMCEDNAPMTCENTVIRGDGLTCGGMALEMANQEGQTCEDLQFWRHACCEEECPPDFPTDTPVIVDPPQDRGYSHGVASGNHPACHLCRDGSYPGNPYMLIDLLYYGAGTCDKWYYFALEGNVVSHQCDALMCKS